jgi:hypothetical protein
MKQKVHEVLRSAEAEEREYFDQLATASHLEDGERLFQVKQRPVTAPEARCWASKRFVRVVKLDGHPQLAKPSRLPLRMIRTGATRKLKEW